MSSAESLARAYANVSGFPRAWDEMDDTERETATILMSRALSEAGIATEHQVWHSQGVARPLREHETPNSLSARMYAAGMRVRERLVGAWEELPPQ